MGKFAQACIEWSNLMPIDGGKVMRKIAFDGYLGILKRSLVRTGRFRGSNRIGVNKVDTSVLAPRTKVIREKFGTTGDSKERQYALDKLRNVKWGDTIHITNSLIYARKLENGSSKQNGNAVDGVYGATFAELSGNLAATIAAAKQQGLA